MGFYYYSIFSVIPLAIAYGLLALVYWGVVRATRGARARTAILSAVGVILLILPISEELWIAWNFGQACKEAGTFIYKKVSVDGFYNDTGASLELVRTGGYRFIEGRGDKGVARVTLGNAELMREALLRFQQETPGKNPSLQDVVRVKLDDKTEALVYPKRGESWRITLLDRPTARYHFKKVHDHTKVSHELKKFEWVVVDNETSEQLARETTYARGPSWYFIGLNRPTLFCEVSGKYGEKLVATLYAVVLQPTARP
jgi:hypothetical protein